MHYLGLTSFADVFFLSFVVSVLLAVMLFAAGSNPDYSGGCGSSHDHHGLMATAWGKVADIANRELGNPIRREITDRVLDGNGADAALPFGYSTRYCNLGEYCGAGPKPKKEVYVNEAEARIVQEIFIEYADGMSFADIARKLNARNVPFSGQSARRGNGGGTNQTDWGKTRIGRILRQRKYIGRWKWGESMHPKTSAGSHIIQAANSCDMVASEQPGLAIVPIELWDAVQERLERNRERYGFGKGRKRRDAQAHYTDDYPANMLGGLLYCGVCGTRMCCATGKSGLYYRCPVAYNSGKAGGFAQCTQRGWVHYGRAVAALIGYLRQDFMNCRAWVDDVHAAAVAEYRRLGAGIPGELGAVDAKLAETVSAIAGMAALIENGDATTAVIERLKAREAEKRKLEAARRRIVRRKNIETNLPPPKWIASQLENLTGLLADAPRKSALFFRRHFGRVLTHIVVAPGKKRGHAELAFTVKPLVAVQDALGFLPDDIVLPESASVATPVSGKVRIALAGNDKLYKLLPTIDAMVRTGKTWRKIGVELKISRSWARRHYRIWKGEMEKRYAMSG
jgi:hypothetical protein